jgi:FMN-dependent dehydrogenase
VGRVGETKAFAKVAVCVAPTIRIAYSRSTLTGRLYCGSGIDLGRSDPLFQKRMQQPGVDTKNDSDKAGRMWIDSVWPRMPSHLYHLISKKAWTWDKITWVIREWKRISNGRLFLLKGIQSVDDALKAVEFKCDRIDRAGRQVDGVVGSLDMLPEIVHAVGDMLTILDSSVRSGSSDAVCVGRLWIRGPSIDDFDMS